jgi:tetratricopeptide (TPR) repeat protein
MIKFFRKIRQNLLNEGKTSKYFKYAIGEIVLVVIGILIALQINTWNENRKSEDVINNYYTQILQDLAKDHKSVNNQILTLRSNIALYNKFVKDFPNQKNPETLVMSATKLNYTYLYLRFNTNTIETLQTTGDIKLLPTKIRNKLIDLRNRQNNAIAISNGNNSSFMNQLLSAGKLGYERNILLLKGVSTQSNLLYKELKAANNFPEIALTLNSAYSLKDFTERDQVNSFTSIINDINTLFSLINKELGNPYDTIETVIKSPKKLETLLESGKTIDNVIAIVKNQDREEPEYDISENYINALAYFVMNKMKQNSEALKLFKLNVELYPNAFNTYDSYGECLLLTGDKESAIKAYQKSLELNPENDSAKKVLSDLKIEN